MKKDPLIFIQHILESIEHIENYCLNISKEEFINTQSSNNICLGYITQNI